MLSDLVSLVFPPACAGCNSVLNQGEGEICTSCLHGMPFSDFHLKEDNPVARLFWGRAEVKKATAFYLYGTESKVQKLIHGLKYQGKKEIARVIGQHFAAQLRDTNWQIGLDAIIPVPLHIGKLKQRGYNQSLYFAEGLAEVLNIPLIDNCLMKVGDSDTQTGRSRYRRWKSVETKFIVQRPELLRGKNILLADDVITTGSTLEACTRELLKVSKTTVSIAAIAYTEFHK